MTYNDLVEEIKYITTKGNEPSFVAQIPSIIDKGEREAQLRLNILQSEKTVEGIISPFTSLILKPFDWLYTVSLTIVNPDENYKVYNLKRRTYGYVRRIQENDDNFGIPEFYTNEAENQYFMFAPKAMLLKSNLNKEYFAYTLRYHVIKDTLNEGNQQNWLTTTYPTLLLQCCLYYAFLMLRNKEMADYHFSKMQELVQVASKTNMVGKTDENIHYRIS